AAVTGADASAAAPFTELGVDSLVSLELRNRLEQALGLRLSATVLLTCGTPAGLVAWLSAQLAPPAIALDAPPVASDAELDAGLDATLAELDAFLAGE
ncbi:MAG TPA: acyl carrier protein, partial [Myxococcota bacterium]|nr:acyl carrier protein [Myxococcota bacterium]